MRSRCFTNSSDMIYNCEDNVKTHLRKSKFGANGVYRRYSGLPFAGGHFQDKRVSQNSGMASRVDFEVHNGTIYYEGR